VSLHVRAIQRLLALGGPSGANDADEIVFAFRVDDNHETSIDRADGDEAILGF
jgi:hypothetical protein